MASTWMYSCKKGLRQDDCDKYEADPKARGYGRSDGCPSCKHREPANDATARADAEHAAG